MLQQPTNTEQNAKRKFNFSVFSCFKYDFGLALQETYKLFDALDLSPVL